MTRDVLASRNTSVGFAQRTARNLAFIEAHAAQGDVHVVTQTLLSVFGLVAFPWAAGLDDKIKRLKYADLVSNGWPEWDVTLGSAVTLDELVRHVRNSVAHRRFGFSSDAIDLASVGIRFEDAPCEDAPVNWRASIEAQGLRTFCVKFAELVDDTVG